MLGATLYKTVFLTSETLNWKRKYIGLKEENECLFSQLIIPDLESLRNDILTMVIVLICFGCSAMISSMWRHCSRIKETEWKGLSQNSSCEIVVLEELHWWSSFLCRKPVYTNWLHLIKITVETVHSVIGWRKVVSYFLLVIFHT